MKRYVMGFCFSPDLKKVAMVKKNRPRWQAGLWNGIGGHVEEDECAEAAMVREFEEETSVHEDSQGKWHLVSTIGNDDYQIEVFASASECVWDVTTVTDENIVRWDVVSLLQSTELTVYNVPWLMLMARERLQGRNQAYYYRIQH